MSNLQATFSCKELGASLTIREANDRNGSGKGSFSMGGVTVPVSIHYHFENHGTKGTNYTIWGNTDNPNHYVGIAGDSKTTGADRGMTLAGGLSISGQTTSFSCFFRREV